MIEFVSWLRSEKGKEEKWKERNSRGRKCCDRKAREGNEIKKKRIRKAGNDRNQLEWRVVEKRDGRVIYPLLSCERYDSHYIEVPGSNPVDDNENSRSITFLSWFYSERKQIQCVRESYPIKTCVKYLLW